MNWNLATPQEIVDYIEEKDLYYKGEILRIEKEALKSNKALLELINIVNENVKLHASKV